MRRCKRLIVSRLLDQLVPEKTVKTAVKRLTVDFVVADAAATAASDHHSTVGDLCVCVDGWMAGSERRGTEKLRKRMRAA